MTPHQMLHKARLFWPVAGTVLLADCASKEAAVRHLTPPYIPHEVLGDVLRLTLAYNRGAAMGVPLGAFGRWGLSLIAAVIVVVLYQLYRRAPAHATGRTLALALLVGGALGNLWDRVRHPRGVVDFIDVGWAAHRFWVFNLADVAVCLGAVWLALQYRADPAPGITDP